MTDNLPFVSFCIKCYNQEKLIGEALRGAFEQTYPNMEIVISDDCSTDGSVAVIRRMVEEYRKGGGKFPVTIIENEKNLGNGGNWLKLCSAAKGEWLVKADGDDRSLPDRVQRLMECWIKGGRKATSLGSDAVLIDMEGRCLGPVRRAVLKTNRIAGCVAAYRRETFDLFGDYAMKDATDDGVFGPRSNLLGPVDYVNEPLVLYRVGAGASRCVRGFRTMRVKNFRATHKWVAQCELDLEKYRPHLTSERYAEEKAGLAAWHAQADGNVAQWDGSWLTRAKGMWARPFCTFLTPGGLMLLVLLLPLRIADFVLDSVLWVHHSKLLYKYGHCFDGCEGRGEHLAERCKKLYRH